jgi:hypothetical protein
MLLLRRITGGRQTILFDPTRCARPGRDAPPAVHRPASRRAVLSRWSYSTFEEFDPVSGGRRVYLATRQAFPAALRTLRCPHAGSCTEQRSPTRGTRSEPRIRTLTGARESCQCGWDDLSDADVCDALGFCEDQRRRSHTDPARSSDGALYEQRIFEFLYRIDQPIVDAPALSVWHVHTSIPADVHVPVIST